MTCKVRLVSARALTGLAAAAFVIAVLGCSESSSGDGDGPVTGAEPPPAAEGAGAEQTESAEPDRDSASAPADSQDEQSEPAPETTTLASSTGADPSPVVIDFEPIASTPREDVPSALRDRNHPDHPKPLVDLGQIFSGGPPPDGIPPLEDPAFEPAGEVDWLAGVDPVLALEINGDARAYPLRIMTWHELVNGAVGGVPVTVSYCPLCNSAVAYDRRVGDRILDFGTSGELFNSALVMYDRQTESLWSHYTGQAVVGHLTGTELDFIPVQTVSYESFLATHPQGHVLSLDTGYSRSYGQNPYEFYDSSSRPFLLGGPFDDRLEPLTRVLALRDGGEGAVIPLDALAERRVVPFSFAGRELVALFEPGTASALDRRNIAEGRDVGATGVFVRSVDGRLLDLSVGAGGGFADATTGVVYDILGQPSDPAGAALEPVEHLDTFWFAAAAFYPDIEIIGQ
ncbi:MAG: DUF3179 domain-containing protein [Acidimicrobiaceae bacterium]|nr:DUF3179 domain-containing protein [Acidimicrobiaceae bacterium]MYE96893.1 DUF3179 domain-containing protein [Acidimicrobiaceae bacterium]MYI53984.1 DUF3179 domain-containing protein [Acidimicrobiaceae bacterium]